MTILPLTQPKLELHVHLDCCASYACVQSLRPQTSLGEYRRDYIAPAKCADLVDFLERPRRMVELLQTEAALGLVTDDLFDQLATDGVIYAEIRFAPLLHTADGLDAGHVVRIVERAVERGIAATGVQARLILCTLRQYTAEQSMRTARLAAEAKARGVVVGFDIAGDEAGFTLDAHVAAFAHARSHGVRLTAHAGEARGADSVSETLDRIAPERIGHGVRSVEDPAVVRRLIDERVHLEVCPTSNVQTMGDRLPAYRDHAVAPLFAAGVPLSISTDARTVCDVTLDREYERLHTAFGWGPREIAATNRAAAEACFAEAPLKARLLAACPPA